MKIQYRVGDATSPIGDGTKIIAHISNDMGGWGRGFVLALSAKWKAPENEYRTWSKRKWKGKHFVLGQIQTIWVEGNTFVCNMIAQRDYKVLEEEGIDIKLPNVNYSSLLECLTRLRLTSLGSSIHMPRIGSGLGGGDWKKIETIINHVFGDVSTPVYVYDLQPMDGTTYTS